MKEYKLWLQIQNLIPVKFYPYSSRVTHRFLFQSHNFKKEEHDFLEELGNQLIRQTIIPWDNKIVIECEITITLPNQTISNIFIGCYDECWSIGLGVRSDENVKSIWVSYLTK